MQFVTLLDLWAVTTTTFLVLLFLRALLHKASDLVRFTGFLGNYHVLPRASLTGAAYGLMVIEAAIVVLLLTPQFNQYGAVLAVSVLLAYAAVMALNIARGNLQIECGCGGPPMLLSYALVLRNVVIAVMGLSLLWVVRTPIELLDAAVAVAGGGILYFLYVAAEQLMANSNHYHIQSYLREPS